MVGGSHLGARRFAGLSPDLQPARAFGIAAAEPAGEARRAMVCFATDRPALDAGERDPCWLDMDGVDLSRMQSGRAPVLLDHVQQVDSIVGVVERAWRNGDACFAILRFGSTPRCLDTWSLLQDGILTNVSVGMRCRVEPEADASGARRVVYWLPYEISFVTVPADWRAFVRARDVPQRIFDQCAAAAAKAADIANASCQAWADAMVAQLAQVSPDARPDMLRRAMVAKVGCVKAEAAAAALAALLGEGST